MSIRVYKKLSTPFDFCNTTGAVLIVSLFYPTIAAARLFTPAIKDKNLPHFVIGNKMDMEDRAGNLLIEQGISKEIHPVSLLQQNNVSTLNGVINSLFPKGARISVLGVFNSGKTGLISHLLQ